MKELEGHVEKGKEVSQGYLSYLLASGHLSLDEVYGSVAELLLAGVDTVRATGAYPEIPVLGAQAGKQSVETPYLPLPPVCSMPRFPYSHCFSILFSLCTPRPPTRCAGPFTTSPGTWASRRLCIRS